ncbi:hypothetical protein AVEN_148252-1 [Araneus ventricosus]|uniref:Uncharacterized protein n=1 Tax=Araneus ventricosus TaxID=182803 RepID=A0A4Y2TJW8_ARAVE|nr:hypothetical protein AVEN_140625-1 [Araneus ventricosus]GBO00321.1 hypothetical protein AVEN_148252-1 [Araneus ventricosus]
MSHNIVKLHDIATIFECRYSEFYDILKDIRILYASCANRVLSNLVCFMFEKSEFYNQFLTHFLVCQRFEVMYIYVWMMMTCASSQSDKTMSIKYRTVLAIRTILSEYRSLSGEKQTP